MNALLWPVSWHMGVDGCETICGHAGTLPAHYATMTSLRYIFLQNNLLTGALTYNMTRVFTMEMCLLV